jgi:hypothetical protein
VVAIGWAFLTGNQRYTKRWAAHDTGFPIPFPIARADFGGGARASDFLRAMHDGLRPDGTKIDETMPWRVYGKMSDPEFKAVWAFLETLPPTPKGKR